MLFETRKFTTLRARLSVLEAKLNAIDEVNGITDNMMPFSSPGSAGGIDLTLLDAGDTAFRFRMAAPRAEDRRLRFWLDEGGAVYLADSRHPLISVLDAPQSCVNIYTVSQ